SSGYTTVNSVHSTLKMFSPFSTKDTQSNGDKNKENNPSTEFNNEDKLYYKIVSKCFR
ncbi:11750_t:CDS:2, partial [Racocetra persica]